ncbi:NAD(P)H-dependent oxidoreductase [Paenibacillus polymyxa]|uniref:NAD(P)H-dependent oxidoreductase n=1 Tax=Paenibacillus polymyxa TaxID=1406 RepID=UPI0023797B2D|nr:NAD(P)H-dependent oxidoreductase [Paenibacillus polymyxa]
MDDVFTHGWAYGSQGDKLKGKKLGIAMSIGDKKENYLPTGSVSFTVDEVIAPFKASDEDINQSAKDYIKYIFQYK